MFLRLAPHFREFDTMPHNCPDSYITQNDTLPPQFDRRQALRLSLAAAGGAALTTFGSGPALAAEASAPPKRVLRIAHLTDVHVQPERGAPQGMAAALRHVHEQADRPDIIFTGGDSIMDSFGANRDRTQVQWSLWQDVLKSECDLPIESCIGNHDVWGWGLSKSGSHDTDAQYGKRWAQEVLKLETPYRSFDRTGWHFIVLDSTHPGPKPGSYVAQLDGEQFDWLADDLSKVPAATPVLILSHIPILSAATFLDGENERSGDWVVPGAWMHIDARKLKNLFKQHPNVKLCLSGHLHLVDRVDYAGVSYLCNGAVCGAWWKGNYHECNEGYALVDLYDDGTFGREYVEYGWQQA